MKADDVQHLAALSRIGITEDEAVAFATDFGAILGYVEQVTAISGEVGERTSPLRNVLREDVETHEPGAYTDALLAAAPVREGDYIHVKKVLEK